MGGCVDQVPSEIGRLDGMHEFDRIGAVRQDELGGQTVCLLIAVKPVASQSPAKQGDKGSLTGQSIDAFRQLEWQMA